MPQHSRHQTYDEATTLREEAKFLIHNDVLAASIARMIRNEFYQTADRVLRVRDQHTDRQIKDAAANLAIDLIAQRHLFSEIGFKPIAPSADVSKFAEFQQKNMQFLAEHLNIPPDVLKTDEQ